jgi:hypothetical protein
MTITSLINGNIGARNEVDIDLVRQLKKTGGVDRSSFGEGRRGEYL